MRDHTLEELGAKVRLEQLRQEMESLLARFPSLTRENQQPKQTPGRQPTWSAAKRQAQRRKMRIWWAKEKARKKVTTPPATGETPSGS